METGAMRKRVSIKTSRFFSFGSNARPAAGFTLVELLMVVVVIGIIAGVSAPTFRGYMQDQKLSAASRDLISNLRFARLRAVNEGNPWVVLFLRGQRAYIVFADDGGGGGVIAHPAFIEDNRGNLRPDPNERSYGPFALTAGVTYGLVTSANLPNGITISNAISFGGSPPRIVFYPNGSARETGVVMIQLIERLRENNARGQRAIILYKPTGAARSFKYNPAGNPSWK